MNVGVIGTGKMGSGLGKRWAQQGHMVMFGSRTPAKAQQLAEAVGVNTIGGSVAEAAAFGDIVLLAVPWSAVPDTLATTGPLAGKTVIDCINPLDPEGLVIACDQSAGELIQGMLPNARVIKAFNAVFSRVIHSSPLIKGQPTTVFFCGEDDIAKGRTVRLIEDAGFDPVDTGPLHMARVLESLAVLIIQLGYEMGMGTQIGLKLLR